MKYYIPKYYLTKLEKLIKALQKKTNVKFEVFEDDCKIETFVDHSSPEQPEYKYLTIAVELEVDYKVGDYEIVAELEHTGNGNIIRQINFEIEVPTTYRNVPCRCEHCNTNRQRKNTFLLVDKNNNFKQVGKTCLNDYTGIDSLSIIEKVSSLQFLLHNDFDDEFLQFLKSNASPKYEPLDRMANIFYQIILEKGYSRENNNPFHNVDEYKYREDLEDKVEQLLNVVNTDWYNDDSNYCYNVKVVLGLGYVEYKHWKLLLSYINSANIYLQKQIQKELERQGLVNEYLGNVGDRIEFEVKSVKKLYTKYTNYTYRGEESYVYRIITTTNNVVIWNTENDVIENSIIKATIKKLTEYKGEKQTVVTRGKIVKINKIEQPKQVEEIKTTNCGRTTCKAIEDAKLAVWLDL